jgi:hypothetical protein
VVPLLISSHNPTQAREANSYLLEIIGLVIVLPGVFLGYTALTAYPLTPMTWIMAGAMLVYFAERVSRIVIPKGQRLTIGEWKKQHHIGDIAIDMRDVKPMETIVSTVEAGQQRQAQRQNNKKAAPIVGLFAIILAGAALYQGGKIARLESTGLRASGEVVRLKEESTSGDHSSYYPIVQYRTERNVRVEFKDSVGSNPPSHRPGEKVSVLYLADNPQSDAIIDRGLWLNWAIPVILWLAAGFVAWLGIVLLRSSMSQKTSQQLPDGLPSGPNS